MERRCLCKSADHDRKVPSMLQEISIGYEASGSERGGHQMGLTLLHVAHPPRLEDIPLSPQVVPTAYGVCEPTS